VAPCPRGPVDDHARETSSAKSKERAAKIGAISHQNLGK
jgi:hypothetical protein